MANPYFWGGIARGQAGAINAGINTSMTLAEWERKRRMQDIQQRRYDQQMAMQNREQDWREGEEGRWQQREQWKAAQPMSLENALEETRQYGATFGGQGARGMLSGLIQGNRVRDLPATPPGVSPDQFGPFSPNQYANALVPDKSVAEQQNEWMNEYRTTQTEDRRTREARKQLFSDYTTQLSKAMSPAFQSMPMEQQQVALAILDNAQQKLYGRPWPSTSIVNKATTGPFAGTDKIYTMPKAIPNWNQFIGLATAAQTAVDAESPMADMFLKGMYEWWNQNQGGATTPTQPTQAAPTGNLPPMPIAPIPGGSGGLPVLPGTMPSPKGSFSLPMSGKGKRAAVKGELDIRGKQLNITEEEQNAPAEWRARGRKLGIKDADRIPLDELKQRIKAKAEEEEKSKKKDPYGRGPQAIAMALLKSPQDNEVSTAVAMGFSTNAILHGPKRIRDFWAYQHNPEQRYFITDKKGDIQLTDAGKQRVKQINNSEADERLRRAGKPVPTRPKPKINYRSEIGKIVKSKGFLEKRRLLGKIAKARKFRIPDEKIYQGLLNED